MGCGGSKNEVIKTSSDITEEADNNNITKNKAVTQTKETLAADATDLPGAVEDRVETESEGFGSSAASSAGKREKALAFTVPGDEDRDPSLIRKHPPLRFRKLEDQQVEISQEMINIKQAEAEKRRSAIIQERAKSARSSSARMRSLPIVKGHYQSRVESAIESHPEMYEEMNVM